MQIFDAPTREKCTIRRPRTNTPLQALVTLNDTQFVEASRHFAQRIIREGGDALTAASLTRFDWPRRVDPRKMNWRILKQVYSAALRNYEADDRRAKSLLSVGESKRDESLNVAEHAAWTIVASTMLNLDETLVRE